MSKHPFANVPWSLVGLRLFLCPLIVAGSWAGANRMALVMALTIGLLSDIFDGIIARRLGVSTPGLRRADSLVDVLFWLSILVSAQITSGFIDHHRLLIVLLLVSEAMCQIISQFRFEKPPATHSYAAKAWGILLFVGFALVLGHHESKVLSDAMLIFGMLVNLEVIAIMLISKTQPVDVASAWSLLRRRKSMKRAGRSAMFGDEL